MPSPMPVPPPVISATLSRNSPSAKIRRLSLNPGLSPNSPATQIPSPLTPTPDQVRAGSSPARRERIRPSLFRHGSILGYATRREQGDRPACCPTGGRAISSAGLRRLGERAANHMAGRREGELPCDGRNGFRGCLRGEGAGRGGAPGDGVRSDAEPRIPGRRARRPGGGRGADDRRRRDRPAGRAAGHAKRRGAAGRASWRPP